MSDKTPIRRFVLLAFALGAGLYASVALAQQEATELPNWTAPASWTPPATNHEGPALRPATGSLAKNVPVKADSVTPSPEYPFTPITPCRLVDTRQSPDTPYLDNGGAGETRTYHFNSVIPYTGTGACSLIPAAAALSLSVQFQVTDHQASLIGYPDDVTRPLVASVVAYNTGLFYMNSAIVPTGTDGGINVFAQWGGQVVININGYYAPLLPYSGSASSPALTDLFTIENTGAGRAMHAIAVSDTALWAQSTSGSGVDGRSSSGVGVYGASTSGDGVSGVGGSHGVYGQNSGNSSYGYLGGVVGAYGNGGNAGVMGESTGGKGVHGKSTSFDGVWGEASASGRSGVYGFNSDSGGYGVTGRNTSNSNYGYLGGTYGVFGTTSIGGAGVCGENTGTYGNVFGVYGHSLSPDPGAAGVYGESTSTTGAVAGVLGVISSSNSAASGVSGFTTHKESSGGSFANNENGVEVLLATTTGTLNCAVSTNNTIYTSGAVVAGVKLFVAPHPEDASKEIDYVSVEAPTADVYFRGTARLENGVARIEIPDHFRLTAREGSYQATVTALASHADLWVEEEDEHGIVVRGTGDVAFHYVVWAERDLYRDEKAVRDNEHFTPAMLERTGALRTLPERVKAVLVKNGTLNPDGTYNRETAERLNWTIPDPPAGWLR